MWLCPENIAFLYNNQVDTYQYYFDFIDSDLCNEISL